MDFTSKRGKARQIYFDLVDGRFGDGDITDAISFLREQLKIASTITENLPDLDDLHSWMHRGVEEVGIEYQAYLERRSAGGSREYFTSRGHALYFLKSVAPTKLVDGAWLFGLLPHWQDPRFLGLIQTYLEELGEGSPAHNHVVLYQKLLAIEGCEHWEEQSDEHFVQGAIQLSLAYGADHFLPEVIGYNLGYEQLPLHLLITSYELRELAIDPYYFTLHVTVDNADSGHARKAVDAISAALPQAGDLRTFYERARNGYRLNFLGAGTLSAIKSFDLEHEVTSIVARKGIIGRHEHSDYHQIGGRTVNDWLSNPGEAKNFLAALQGRGWIKRNQDPANSRFWKLIQGPKAPMFGVFNGYEKELLYEWIAGSFEPEIHIRRNALASSLKRSLQETHPEEHPGSDFDKEVETLRASMAQAPAQDVVHRLISLMSPASHHSSAGLEATRVFCEMLK